MSQGPKLFDAFAIFMKYQWFSFLVRHFVVDKKIKLNNF